MDIFELQQLLQKSEDSAVYKGSHQHFKQKCASAVNKQQRDVKSSALQAEVCKCSQQAAARCEACCAAEWLFFVPGSETQKMKRNESITYA